MSEVNNSEKADIGTSQEIYTAFNDFIFSSDIKVLGKLVARTLLAEETSRIPGDIVECGVYKGSGILTWLKLKQILFPNALKKVIGFDYFDTVALLDSLNGLDRQRMSELFQERGYQHETGAEQFLMDTIFQAGFTVNDVELVKGDVSESIPKFLAKRPGFKISVLYMDLDLDVCTYNALSNLWSRVSRGGVVVFDEYAYHQWSEAQGVDRFFEDKDVEIKVLDYVCPTAYVRK